MYQFSEPCLESAFRLDVDEVVITGQTVARERGREVLVFETRLVEAGAGARLVGVRAGLGGPEPGC